MKIIYLFKCYLYVKIQRILFGYDLDRQTQYNF